MCCAVMSHAILYHEVSGGGGPIGLEVKERGHIKSLAGLAHSVGGLAHSVGGQRERPH